MKARFSVQRSFTRLLNQKFYSGLLSGFENVEDIKKSRFYASSMDLQRTAKFLKQPAYVYQQALKDLPQSKDSSIDEYLSRLSDNKLAWLEKNSFYDRELILQSIKSVIANKGQFVCLLGGKSTGKTLLFDHLTQPENNFKHNSVIHLNMRDFPQGDILKALLARLLNSRTERTYSKLSDAATAATLDKLYQVFSVYLSAQGIPLPENLQVTEILNLLREKNITDSDAIMDLLSRLSVAFGNITAVIDEANLALTPKLGDGVRLRKANDDLEVLTKLSKEAKKVPRTLSCYSKSKFYSVCNLGQRDLMFLRAQLSVSLEPSWIQ